MTDEEFSCTTSSALTVDYMHERQWIRRTFDSVDEAYRFFNTCIASSEPRCRISHVTTKLLRSNDERRTNAE